MTREKGYIYKVEFPAKRGGVMTARIDYLPDRPSKPWAVRVDLDEASPAYATVAAARTFLLKHYWHIDDQVLRVAHLATKTQLYDQLRVPLCDR